MKRWNEIGLKDYDDPEWKLSLGHFWQRPKSIIRRLRFWNHFFFLWPFWLFGKRTCAIKRETLKYLLIVSRCMCTRSLSTCIPKQIIAPDDHSWSVIARTPCFCRPFLFCEKWQKKNPQRSTQSHCWFSCVLVTRSLFVFKRDVRHGRHEKLQKSIVRRKQQTQFLLVVMEEHESVIFTYGEGVLSCGQETRGKGVKRPPRAIECLGGKQEICFRWHQSKKLSRKKWTKTWEISRGNAKRDKEGSSFEKATFIHSSHHFEIPIREQAALVASLCCEGGWRGEWGGDWSGEKWDLGKREHEPCKRDNAKSISLHFHHRKTILRFQSPAGGETFWNLSQLKLSRGKAVMRLQRWTRSSVEISKYTCSCPSFT